MKYYLDKDLEKQKILFLDILNLIINQLKDVENMFINKDELLAKSIIDKENELDWLHDKFIKMSLWKITKQQMISTDLRRAVGFILIMSEIKRIGNYAIHLAKYFKKYNPENKFVEEYFNNPLSLKEIIKMIIFVKNIIIKEDLTYIKKVLIFEKNIDKIFKENNKKLIINMKKNQSATDIKLFNVTIQQLKYIERAGDRLIYICELFLYIKKGKFINIFQLNI